MDSRKFITKTAATTFLLAVVVLSVFPSIVKAQSYGGTVPPDLNTFHPSITFVPEGYSSINFFGDGDTIMTPQMTVLASAGNSERGWFCYIYNVSYRASWINETRVAYQSNINPTLFQGYGDRFSRINFTLFDIPSGPQQIEVVAAETGVYVNFTTNLFDRFYINSTRLLNFYVSPQPTSTATSSPTPNPTATPSPTEPEPSTPLATPTQQPTTKPSPNPVGNLYSNWFPYALVALAVVLAAVILVHYRKIRNRPYVGV